MESNFRRDLESFINRHSMENGSNTPDFILANFLFRTLEQFDLAVNARENWYGRKVPESMPAPPPPGYTFSGSELRNDKADAATALVTRNITNVENESCKHGSVPWRGCPECHAELAARQAVRMVGHNCSGLANTFAGTIKIGDSCKYCGWVAQDDSIKGDK